MIVETRRGIFYLVMENLCGPAEIKIALGTTLSERLQTVAEIKNAMVRAMMLQIENDLLDNLKENPDFVFYQILYLEANHVEWELKQI